ncbi:sphinganine kinase [Saccharomycopsis crataegensis]|uniref:Sphinganine kinase n=1 Tax=Saccharomycopsis crataegensis TaxID=43959 RepID=A0AAV5QWC7_9ASCO|nr:sphinganine kinase [Saccharomycopsis crataegensis]
MTSSAVDNSTIGTNIPPNSSMKNSSPITLSTDKPSDHGVDKIRASIVQDGSGSCNKYIIKLHNQNLPGTLDVQPENTTGFNFLGKCFPVDDAAADDTRSPSEISFDDIIWVGNKTAGTTCYTDHAEDSHGGEYRDELTDNEVAISYMIKSDSEIVPVTKTLIIDNLDMLPNDIIKKEAGRGDGTLDQPETNGSNEKLAQFMLSQAYSDPSFLQRRILILINPNGGAGEALKRFKKYIQPILKAAHVQYEVMETNYHYHCLDIVKDLDFSKYDIIACCSGDGIPHEVINGIYRRKDKVEIFNRIIVTQLPCGSGNAFSLTCHKTLSPSYATLSLLKSAVIKMDLMAINQGHGEHAKYHLSFLSQTYGMIADADIGTEWMRRVGPVRFDLGVGYKVITQASYPCELFVKYHSEGVDEVVDHFKSQNKNSLSNDGHQVSEENFDFGLPSLNEDVPSDWTKVEDTNSLSVFYTGKMPYIAKDTQFFPAALPNDGTMDLVVMHSDTSFLKKLEILLSIDTGKHIFHKDTVYGKITAYRLIPLKNNYISVDGESFPLEPIQAEVIPKVLNIISKDGNFMETVLHETTAN